MGGEPEIKVQKMLVCFLGLGGKTSDTFLCYTFPQIPIVFFFFIFVYLLYYLYLYEQFSLYCKQYI